MSIASFAGAASRIIAGVALFLLALVFAAEMLRGQDVPVVAPDLRIEISTDPSGTITLPIYGPPWVPPGKPAPDPWLRSGQWALGIATAADVATTLARPRNSREANPLVPQGRAMGALVSGSLGALGIWGSGRLAQHGHRRLARGIAWGSATLRGYAAVRCPR